MKWLIETQKEVPSNIDDYVQGLEDLLNMHVDAHSIVHVDATSNPLEWTTGLLEGVAFVQSQLFDNPSRELLIRATLNIANIALTFNRSLTSGAYTELGILEAVQPNALTVLSTNGEEAEVQGGSQELPEPAFDKPTGMGGNAGTSSINGDDIV